MSNLLSSAETDGIDQKKSLSGLLKTCDSDLTLSNSPFEADLANGYEIYGVSDSSGDETNAVLWNLKPNGGYPTTLVTHGNDFMFRFRVLSGNVNVFVHRQGEPGVRLVTLGVIDDARGGTDNLFTLRSGDSFAMINSGDQPCVLFDQGNKPFLNEYEEPLPERDGIATAAALAVKLCRD